MHKWQNLLGMAMRARRVALGDSVLASIQYVFVENAAWIDEAIGQHNRKSVAILDSGFAKSIQSCMKG